MFLMFEPECRFHKRRAFEDLTYFKKLIATNAELLKILAPQRESMRREMQNQGTTFFRKVVSKVKEDSSSHTAKYFMTSVSSVVTAVSVYVFSKATHRLDETDKKKMLLGLEANVKAQEELLNHLKTRLDLLERAQKNPLSSLCHWLSNRFSV